MYPGCNNEAGSNLFQRSLSLRDNGYEDQLTDKGKKTHLEDFTISTKSPVEDRFTPDRYQQTRMNMMNGFHNDDQSKQGVPNILRYRRQSSLPLDALKKKQASVRNAHNLNMTEQKNAAGNTMPNRQDDQKLYKSIDSIRQDMTVESRDDVTEKNQNRQYCLDGELLKDQNKEQKAFKINEIARFTGSSNQHGQNKQEGIITDDDEMQELRTRNSHISHLATSYINSPTAEVDSTTKQVKNDLQNGSTQLSTVPSQIILN